MKRSTISIKKEGKYFDDAQAITNELMSDVTDPVWADTMNYIREREYDGTIIHTYVKFNNTSNELSQIFAAEDLTTIQSRIYNCPTVKNLLDAAEKKGWHVRIENS
jgi:hypothetical protein